MQAHKKAKKNITWVGWGRQEVIRDCECELLSADVFVMSDGGRSAMVARCVRHACTHASNANENL
jgi:hypothetical protein